MSKDRKLRLVDPRKGATVSEAAAHQGVKPMKIAFASQANKILTTGTSLWAIDIRNHYMRGYL